MISIKGSTKKNTLRTLLKVLNGEAIIISEDQGRLVIDTGNKSSEDIKTIAATFFKSAYKLANKID